MAEWSLILPATLITRSGLLLALADWAWFAKGCSNWPPSVENKTVWLVGKCMYCKAIVNGNLRNVKTALVKKLYQLKFWKAS